MYKILIVDDEARIRDLIRKYAEFEGHSVSEASDGLSAVHMCRQHDFDIVIMDVMMPELDGFSACREIRKASNVPILMLSARGEEYDRINGFQLGIDDYVTKPFSPKELMLRIEAIMKRTGANRTPTDNAKAKFDVYETGGLAVNFTARTVTVDGVRTDLSPKEYDLLFYMIRNRNIALTRDKLICEVWGYDFYGGDRTLDTHIKLLRKSIGKYADHIVTLRGVGYRFDDPVK
ncbi:MAG: response regulator transcription factor [Clostridia bacterium]|nr:response regulator transcription factor [Clostridia bacterium]MBQ1934240.1 response regulator transcription factor [Clostridia bacterium]MBQ5809002.1 response regulator transcription factor [Clostridia bacterium]